jgi:hypothetical protein
MARHTYALHPDMVTITRHTPDDWYPKGYDDRWTFTLADGVKFLRFEKIGYADIAKESYAEFSRLRTEGVVPQEARFKVALPFVESATRGFIDTPEHWEILWPAYVDAIGRELDEICTAIPHDDLVIQWDMCFEVAAVEGIPANFGEEGLASLSADPMLRHAEAMTRLCARIPDDVWLGIHLCYGSLGHKKGETADSGHFCEIKDLNVCVDMTHNVLGSASRKVQFVHMPVQYSNGFDDSFYEPLQRLDAPDSRLFIGLIHMHDGLEGALRRIDVARRHRPEFGVATPCGWGRRPEDQSIAVLLQLHRDLVDATS